MTNPILPRLDRCSFPLFDSISLRADEGKYVVAERNGDGNAKRGAISVFERFILGNMQNIRPIPSPGTEGWQHIATGLKQISVGMDELWGAPTIKSIATTIRVGNWFPAG